MTQNQFKPFAISEHAVVQSQEDYEKSTALKDGFKTGLARSSEVNKAIRQATSVASVVAGFTAEKSGEDMLDNGDIDTMKRHFETAIRTISSTLCAEAQGTGNTLAATFIPTLKQLTSGKTVLVCAREKNLTKNPTFRADENDARTIVKGNNLPLEAGDIAGAGHWLEMQYDGELDKWILQNPAKGVTPQSGVPVGTIEYFATVTLPAGYLKADGTAVSREVYPDLFAAIGTTFGEGDRQTTFNLPDLIDRFAQGSSTPGQKVEAGLPNITGSFGDRQTGTSKNGCFYTAYGDMTGGMEDGVNINRYIGLDASRSNPIYGASDTVQPPALTLLPCIKAFDAATNPGLIDITELANEMAGKVDRVIDNKPVRYVIDAYNDGTNWYRKWSDGWVEQGGINSQISSETVIITLPLAMSDSNYYVSRQIISDYSGTPITARLWTSVSDITATKFTFSIDTARQTNRWYVCGQGAQS